MKLLGLAGLAGAGKDTVADLLVEKHGWRRLAFADALRAVLAATDPIVDAPCGGAFELEPLRLSHELHILPWDTVKRAPEVRALLQRLGVAVRDHVDPDAWINVVRDQIHHARHDKVPGVVVTDVRFDNEVDLVRSYGGAVAVVRRPGHDPGDWLTEHSSEQLALRPDHEFDAVLRNDRTIEHLAGQVGVLVDLIGGRT